MRATILAIILLSGTLVATGCTNKVSTGDSSGPVKMSTFDVNKYAVNTTACNPLSGGNPPTDPSAGIHATLSYLSSSQPRYSNVSDMINNGTPSKQDLFFTEINVPTRLFTEGFPLQSGGMIKDDLGNDLLEWFAIRFQGTVHLGPNDVEGDYQLGMLADDGAIMSLSNDVEGNNFQVVVNDDGTHPTMMDCGPTIQMTKDTSLAMRIDYYQGPRYHIALVPLWRPVNMSTPRETLCGVSGNNAFFDYNNNSAPLTNYIKLLADGWRPLNAANYSVSPSTGYNPCVDGTAPGISNVAISYNVELNTVTVTWNTDIEATDQVLITNPDGTQTLTTSDNVLRTSHSVSLVGVLFRGETYTIQAVSISADLGKSIGAPITYTLP